MLRQRKKSPIYAVEVIKQLDSFPKVTKDDFVVRSRIGGTISVIAELLILWIIYQETSYFLDGNIYFKFMPDTQYDAKLSLNLDLIVAMPCHSIGADILDSTNQNMRKFGSLDMEATWFEMSPEQEQHFNDVQQFNSYLREEFHAINHVLWKSRHTFQPKALPKRSVVPDYPPDACRIFGTLVLNKVAGNMHVTAGKSFALPDSDGHIHFSPYLSQSQYNFSHRIHHLSFGDYRVGIINPLDGDEKISRNNMALYQYFIEVVPTDVSTYFSQAKTYQYSVNDNMRVINHDKGSHGVPGIFFKYDVSALKVVVTQAHEPEIQFCVRLTSTIAGVFVTAGIVKDLIQFIAKKFRSIIGSDGTQNEDKKPLIEESDGVVI